MKLEDVRTIAKSHSIKLDHLSKTGLIKAIQKDEGNFDCFATARNGECDQADCLWRDDCFDAAHKLTTRGELS
ncbi:MAG: SAP domain-containing protein [Nitrosomonadales bacterium]|nr:SAP domain-containing protein [Nitrosomonadales bacterium]